MRTTRKPARRRRSSGRLAGVERLEDRLAPADGFGLAFGIGGLGSEVVRAMIAPDGPIVVGSFSGVVDFDPGPGVFNLTSKGGTDAFLASYDRMGRLLWATSFGGPGDDQANAIDQYLSRDYFYIAGKFTDQVDLAPAYGPTSLKSEGGSDGFLACFDFHGGLRWARRVGGAGDDEILGIAQMQYDFLVVTGTFTGTANFDPELSLANSSRTLTSAGGTDAFFLKLTLNGTWNASLRNVSDPSSSWSWAERAGGAGDDGGTGIVILDYSSIYVTGYFSKTADFRVYKGIPGPRDEPHASEGGTDAFVAELDDDGHCEFVTTFGGPGDDRGLAIDWYAGTIEVGGSFEDTADFSGGQGFGRMTSAGGTDAFVARYDGDYGLFYDVATAGGAGDDATYALEGGLAAGQFFGTVDFDPGPGTFELHDAGRGSAFLWIRDESRAFRSARGYGGTGPTKALAVGGWKGFIAGTFRGVADFGRLPGDSSGVASEGGDDGFVVKTDDSPDMIPIAQDDMYRVASGRELIVQDRYEPWRRVGIVVNDLSRQGFAGVLIASGSVEGPRHGRLWLDSGTGAFSYIADPGFTGIDSFTYRVEDGSVLSNVATVTFTVVGDTAKPPAETPRAYLDLGADGLWALAADGSRIQLHTENPEGLATAPSGRVFLDFGARGLWAWSPGQAAYALINASNPEAIAVGRSGVLYVDFGPFGLWDWSEGVGFRQLIAANPQGIAPSPDGTLYVDFGPYGLWDWREGMGFHLINASNPEGLAVAPDGLLYVDFGPFGLWDWSEGGGFHLINASNPEGLAVAPDGLLYIDFGPFGFWHWREGVGFHLINASNPDGLAIGSDGIVYIDFGPFGLWDWREGVGFRKLGDVNADRIGAV